MINAVTVISHSGETLRCELADPERTGFAIANITGITPGKSNVNVKDIATLDGGYFQNARLPSRNIVIDYIFLDVYMTKVAPAGGGDPVWIEHYRPIEQVRQEFYHYYVVKKPVTLVFETDLHKYVIEGYVESNEPEIFSDMEGAQVSIICPNPYFHLADDGLNENGNMSESVFNQGGSFFFEWSNPRYKRTIQFGNPEDIIREKTVTIYYSGDVDTGVIFHVSVIGSFNANYIDFDYYGSDGSQRITTVRFNDMAFRAAGYGLRVGDELIISTVPGNKYAKVKRGGTTINAFAYVDLLPDWLMLQKGDNIIHIEVNSLVDNMPNVYITMEYPILYAGV